MKTPTPTPCHLNVVTINEPLLKPVDQEQGKQPDANTLPSALAGITHAEKLQHSIQSFYFSMFTAYKLCLKSGGQNHWKPLISERYLCS